MYAIMAHQHAYNLYYCALFVENPPKKSKCQIIILLHSSHFIVLILNVD